MSEPYGRFLGTSIVRYVVLKKLLKENNGVKRSDIAKMILRAIAVSYPEGLVSISQWMDMIIKHMVKAGLVEKKDKRYYVTEKGARLVESLEKFMKAAGFSIEEKTNNP